MIDLHTHSAASDGSHTPAELIAQAARAKISLIALCDHDTIAGIGEFLEAAAREPSVEAIGGIEISSVYAARNGAAYHAHVLGYGVVGIGGPFARRLEEFRQARDVRGAAIVARLRELGVDLTLEEATAAAGGAVFGRPHIAAALIAKGIVKNTEQAFRRFLGEGAKAYVERERPTAIEAVRVLREERLAPVLAHPPIMRMPEDELDGCVRQLRDNGLMGIEGVYPTYSPVDVELCRRLATRYGLIRTGGSDFHGACKPDIKLGVGMGKLRVPHPWGERLQRAIESLKAAG